MFDLEQIILNKNKDILVVEKLSVYERMKQIIDWTKLNVMLLTGSGSPDFMSHFLLAKFSQMPEIKIFALTDFDLDGIGIFKTYRDGSNTCLHLNELLAARTIQRIGLNSEECKKYSIPMLKLDESEIQQIKNSKSKMSTDGPLIKDVDDIISTGHKATLDRFMHVGEN